MPEAKPAVIHTDGACLGNPGPAGAGYVIVGPSGTVLAEGSLPLGHGTNNLAEYRAVMAALEEARKLGLTHLVVRSDSELLVKQMKGQYRVKDQKLRGLHVQVRRLMEAFDKVHFEHVGRDQNSRADELASAAARLSARQVS
jgi:ribonuclease HI